MVVESFVVPESARKYINTPRRDMDPSTRVVVTGMGAVTAIGVGVEEMWKNLIDGKSGVVKHKYEPIPRIVASIAANVPEEYNMADLIKGLVPQKTINRQLHRSAMFSILASYEALSQAGLLVTNTDEDEVRGKWMINPDIVDRYDIGAYIGTGVGGFDAIGEEQRRIDSDRDIKADTIFHTLPERVATAVSLAYGIKGPVEEITAACATGNKNIAAGMRAIIMGDASMMLVGGTEAANTPLGTAQFDVLHALSREEDERNAPRPFDKAASGFVMGEGAGILVLERLDVARMRGVRIIAELTGYGDHSDAHHVTDPSGVGAWLGMNRALDMAERKRKVGRTYTNYHGTGTEKGDPKEALVVKSVYEERKMKVAGGSSTKGATGHDLGATGAVEAIIVCKSLETQIMPPTLRVENPVDEAQGLNLVPNEAQHAEFDTGINNSFGFGGVNSVTVFQSYY